MRNHHPFGTACWQIEGPGLKLDECGFRMVFSSLHVVFVFVLCFPLVFDVDCSLLRYGFLVFPCCFRMFFKDKCAFDFRKLSFSFLMPVAVC